MELLKILGWDHLKSEWAVIKTAPVAFVAVLIFGAWCGYQMAGLRYEAAVQNLDTAGKTKDALITSLREKTENANNGSQTLAESSDPDAIYQLGRKVGDASDIRIKLDEGTVIFGALSASKDFNKKAQFEFRGFKLEIAGFDASSSFELLGMVQSQNFSGVKASIVGRR